MSEVLTLEGKTREKVGTSASKRLRRDGRVPAVICRPNEDSLHLSIKGHELNQAIFGGQRLLDLQLDGKGQKVLIRDVQWDTYGQLVLHVDLETVDMTQKLELAVPIALTGEPVGARDGGVTDHVLHEVSVSCLPDNIPDEVIVDISELGIGDALHLSELPTIDGVEYITGDDDQVVVTIAAPRDEEEAPAEGEEGEAPAEPEVIGSEGGEEESAE